MAFAVNSSSVAIAMTTSMRYPPRAVRAVPFAPPGLGGDHRLTSLSVELV